MTDPFPVTIFHNPDCGTSRNVLKVIEAAGYSPTVVDYRTSGWTVEQLRRLFQAAGLSARQALRDKGSPATDLGLLEPGVTEATILDAMVSDPILVNRPFVVTPKGTGLCRPSERVLDLLETWPKGPFRKEDGDLMIDEDGYRV